MWLSLGATPPALSRRVIKFDSGDEQRITMSERCWSRKEIILTLGEQRGRRSCQTGAKNAGTNTRDCERPGRTEQNTPPPSPGRV